MLGNRLKQARLAAGLTLEEVANRLSSPLTKAGLSKYELGKSRPGAALLKELGRVLGVPMSYFLEERSAVIQWGEFRKKSALKVKPLEQVKAMATDLIEKQLWLERLLGKAQRPPWPRYKASTEAEAEEAALQLRADWKLGTGPIEALTQIIEEQGGIVVPFDDGDGHLDGLSAWAQPGNIPVILVAWKSADRYRLSLAHELAHLVLDTGMEPGKQNENLAFRFGGALLVPKETVRRELGDKRRNLDLAELKLLKLKHGISMQAWLRRALDSEVIERSYYDAWCRLISVKRWRNPEPVKYENTREEPLRLKQFTLHAFAEKLISRDRAHQLCPDLTLEMDQPLSPSALLKLPKEERDALMAASALAVLADYQENSDLVTEAFGDEDLYE